MHYMQDQLLRNKMKMR